MKFPIFRKYTNNNTYFKILSENEFEEMSCIGNQPVTYHIIAEQYPEKLRIMDMINCSENIWTIISEQDYEEQKKLFLSGRA